MAQSQPLTKLLSLKEEGDLRGRRAAWGRQRRGVEGRAVLCRQVVVDVLVKDQALEILLELGDLLIPQAVRL